MVAAGQTASTPAGFDRDVVMATAVTTARLRAEESARPDPLAEAGVARSVGTVGDALDSALAESTIGLFKTRLDPRGVDLGAARGARPRRGNEPAADLHSRWPTPGAARGRQGAEARGLMQALERVEGALGVQCVRARCRRVGEGPQDSGGSLVAVEGGGEELADWASSSAG
jgi:hypothetical protein